MCSSLFYLNIFIEALKSQNKYFNYLNLIEEFFRMAIPKIIILSEILRGQTIELTKDEYTIGRTDDNDIPIPDGTISTHHAKLVRSADGGYLVVDNGSTNGTRVNGIKVTTQELSNSDILQCGGIEILFDCEDKANTQSLTTQTGINLDQTGELNLEQMKGITTYNNSNNTTPETNKAVVIAIGALVAVVIALLIVLVLKVF